MMLNDTPDNTAYCVVLVFGASGCNYIYVKVNPIEINANYFQGNMLESEYLHYTV